MGASKAKIVWSCFIGACGLLAWFGLFSWPKDSAAAMSWLNAIDNAVFRPAAHPTLFALVVGVALGTIIIPEAWRVFRETAFPGPARPDWDMADAIIYMRTRSKWAIGRLNYVEQQGRLIDEDIDQALRDAAAQERISIWGRPAQTGTAALFTRGTEIRIPREHLEETAIDLTVP